VFCGGCGWGGGVVEAGGGGGHVVAVASKWETAQGVLFPRVSL